MRKDVSIYLILMLISLGGAYYVSLPKSKSKDQKILWRSIAPISKIEFEFEGVKTTITKEGSSYWIQHKDQEFQSSKKISQIIDFFASMEIERNLGELTEKKEFGFNPPTGVLSIVSQGVTTAFDIGKKAYGTSHWYLFDKEKQKLILVKGQALDALKSPKRRLFKSKIISIPLNEITAATLKTSSQSLALSHTNRNDKGKIIWTRNSSPEELKFHSNFFDRILKIRAESYRHKELNDPFLSLELKANNESPSLHFFKEGDDFFVKGSHILNTVKISKSRGQSVYTEINQIFN